MKVILRFPQRREVEVAGHRKLQDVVKELGLNPETIIVLQGKTLLTRDAYLKEEDTIEVLSAISGG